MLYGSERKRIVARHTYKEGENRRDIERKERETTTKDARYHFVSALG
jgi:hypothetical protein